MCNLVAKWLKPTLYGADYDTDRQTDRQRDGRTDGRHNNRAPAKHCMGRNKCIFKYHVFQNLT